MKTTYTIVILVLLLFFSCISCSEKPNREKKIKNTLYLDSLTFKYYRKSNKPHLISSTSYAFNDSMSQFLDTAKSLSKASNSIDDLPYDNQLKYTQDSDTIYVEIIYTRGNSAFGFGEIRSQGDSIFLRLTGFAYKSYPQTSKGLKVPYRYFKSEFKILVDTIVYHKIYFDYNDRFKAKPQ